MTDPKQSGKNRSIPNGAGEEATDLALFLRFFFLVYKKIRLFGGFFVFQVKNKFFSVMICISIRFIV